MSVTELPNDPTRARRDLRRFQAALALFFVWVAILGALAFLTGRSPVQNPAAIERR
jgi:hypothetical protein